MRDMTRKQVIKIVVLAYVLVGVIPVSHAYALRVGDLTRLKGTRINRLTGLGLVTGLNGTGDGDTFAQSIRGFAQFLNRFSAPVIAGDELDLKNIAMVALTVTLPEHGVREGDTVDVEVSAIGGAKSILGGRLLQSPLAGPHGDNLYAFAAGAIIGDEDNPNVGRIRNGAVMEADVIHSYITTGSDLIDLYRRANKQLELIGLQTWIQPERHYVTLLIEESQATYQLAQFIAKIIDDDFGDDPPGEVDAPERRPLALAMSPREVVVEIPPPEQNRPASFIGNVQAIDFVMLPEHSEARVVINRKRGTIVATDGVEISPAGIAVRGMTISTAPPPSEDGAPTDVAGTPRSFVTLDQKLQQVDERGAKLKNLLAALNQLQVDTDRQMDVIEELRRAGQLHAKLIVVEE